MSLISSKFSSFKATDSADTSLAAFLAGSGTKTEKEKMVLKELGAIKSVSKEIIDFSVSTKSAKIAEFLLIQRPELIDETAAVQLLAVSPDLLDKFVTKSSSMFDLNAVSSAVREFLPLPSVVQMIQELAGRFSLEGAEKRIGFVSALLDAKFLELLEKNSDLKNVKEIVDELVVKSSEDFKNSLKTATNTKNVSKILL